MYFGMLIRRATIIRLAHRAILLMALLSVAGSTPGADREANHEENKDADQQLWDAPRDTSTSSQHVGRRKLDRIFAQGDASATTDGTDHLANVFEHNGFRGQGKGTSRTTKKSSGGGGSYHKPHRPHPPHPSVGSYHKPYMYWPYWPAPPPRPRRPRPRRRPRYVAVL